MMRNTHSPSSILICTLHTVGTLPYEVCTIREFLGPLQLGFLRVMFGSAPCGVPGCEQV